MATAAAVCLFTGLIILRGIVAADGCVCGSQELQLWWDWTLSSFKNSKEALLLLYG